MSEQQQAAAQAIGLDAKMIASTVVADWVRAAVGDVTTADNFMLLANLTAAAIQAERDRADQAEARVRELERVPAEPVWPDDYILTVRAYLDSRPGYSHELRRDHPQDVTDLLGSIEGELDGCTSGDAIRVLWPDQTRWHLYTSPEAVATAAADVFRDLQGHQQHGRIIVACGDHELMYLTEYVSLAEWEAEAEREFAGW